jgi:hypothetical protein
MVMTSLRHLYYRNIHMERLKKTKRIASKAAAIQTGCNSSRHLSNTITDLHLPLPCNRWWWRLPFDLLGKNRWPRPECRHARPGLIPKDVVTWVCQRIHIRVVGIEGDVQFLFLQYLKFRCVLAV